LVRVDQFAWVAYDVAMTTSSATCAKPRRVQARGEATRLRILEATLSCIAEEGYANTSTVQVCQRSGTSRGSLLHQFSTRAELMAAAVAYLFDQLTADYLEAFAALQADALHSVARRIEVAGELLLAGYAEPRLAAVLDVYAAARTDAELMAALKPVAAQHRKVVRELAHEFFPATATSKRAARRLAVVLDALQGLAFRSVVHPEGARDTIEGAKELLVEVVTDARTAGAAGTGKGGTKCEKPN
jgi:AcrR family transcriptional regulator